MCRMFSRRSGFLVGSCLVLLTLAFLGLERDVQSGKRTATGSASLHDERTSATDLEIGGELAGLPEGGTHYLTREDLFALRQVTYMVTDDPNFTPTRVKGVLLEDLPGPLHSGPNANLVVAICNDKYRANYPQEYMAQHHPLLVLEINGQPPSGWPKHSGGGGFDMGPYLISHSRFVPSFKILSHSDEAQIPWGVVRLEFRNPASVFGAISPPRARNDPAVDAGYKIAQQNCFRCHNMGNEGGQKSGVPWQALAQVAAGSAQWFSAYVRNPKSKNLHSQMPGSAQYDDETMRALVSYFDTFTPTPTAKD